MFFLQLADAPHLRMDVLQWSRHHRLFPGQGAFDLPAFLGHVLAAGYAGPLSLEVFNDVFRQSDPARAAVDAMRSLLALQEATTQRPRRPPTAAACPAGTRRWPGTPSPSSRSTASPARTARARAARHWASPTPGSTGTKPVELWEQGAAGSC